MALVHCPECTAEISSGAMRCPKCGVQLLKPKRGVFGRLIKWIFITFNLLMPLWIIGGVGQASEGYAQLNEAEQAGAAIGAGIGVTLLLMFWVIGDIILGLFVLLTRPKG